MDIENLSPLPAGPLAADAEDRTPIFHRDRQLFAAEIIAEFANGKDAETFATLKIAAGMPVTVTAGINYIYAVRRMVRVS